jgi:oligopeptide/dipeptide ABC transporter ATP-binding protein
MLLSVADLRVHFQTDRGLLRAVDGVTFEIAQGETVGLVGESGCGKSTLGRALIRLVPVTSGQVMLEGTDVTTADARALRRLRPLAQMVFQDPHGSLNPRRAIGSAIAQPLVLAGWTRRAARARAADLLRRVGLGPEAAERFPHEFSGGQRQRIGIARALALDPKLIICDEPVSALDVSIRAQVINLLHDIQTTTRISYLFISHDLSVVEHIADRVIVMYLGRIVEIGTRARIWAQPLHPYTLALIGAAPVANPRLARARRRAVIAGDLPSPLAPPSGCAFHTRCPIAVAQCRVDVPEMREIAPGASVSCHLAPQAGAILEGRVHDAVD